MKLMNFLPMGAAALLLAFSACTDEMTEVQSGELKQIVMTASDFETEDGSRTNFQITSAGAEFSWAANDTVGIFPNEGAQAYFPMTSGAGTKTANFTGGGWALKDASTYAAYYPFIGDFYLNKNAIPVDYTGQVQTGDASTAHLGVYDYMAAAPSTPKNGNVSFAFKHLGALVQLKLTLPQATTLNSVALTTESEAFAVKGQVDIMSSTLGITPITSSKEVTLEVKNIATTQANQVVTLYMMLPPVDLTGKTLKAVVKTSAGREEVALESKNFLAGKAYALSGSLKDPSGGAVAGNGTYKDGVVSIATAGTMKKLLGDDYLNITSLKVVGPINGDDVYYLRKMLGGNNFSAADWGKLTTLDLSEATIVEGGEWYYEYSSSKRYYTSNNEIGDYMFHECANLQDIILPKNGNSIGIYAFAGCQAIINVTIGNNIITICDHAFAGCISIENIIIPNNVITIGKSSFNGCTSLSNISIGDKVVSIDDWAFSGCAMISINIPDNVNSIGVRAFYDCNQLETVFMGRGVSLISLHAFENTPIKNIYIKDLSAWCNIDFYDDYYETPFFEFGDIYLNNTLLTELQIPEDVTKIKSCAFYGCSSITKVVIPNHVSSIEDNAFRSSSIDEVTIYGSGNTSIGKDAFFSCTDLKYVYIDNGVTSIGETAFCGCDALTEVSIGNGITNLRMTFYCCQSLRKVVIGSNVESLGYYTFGNYLKKSYSIEEFYCHTTTPPSLGDYCFNYAIKEGATLYVPARCGSAYKSSSWGNYFKNIVEMD